MIEPTMECPKCKATAYAQWVDNGFGPYAVQAGPYHCGRCGWVEGGCPAEVCIGEKCQSFYYCKGKA